MSPPRSVEYRRATRGAERNEYDNYYDVVNDGVYRDSLLMC